MSAFEQSELSDNSRSQLAAFVLLIAGIIAVVLANSPWAQEVRAFWHGRAFGVEGRIFSVQALIDQGLMTLFFLVVGLELKREIMRGALRRARLRLLPVSAAIGGMVVPILFYVGLNPAAPAIRGFGVPMATDIAFAVGVAALLGRRVPRNLLVFLLALAAVDDLGALLVIAVYYAHPLQGISLAGVGVVLIVLWWVHWRQWDAVIVYGLLGGVLWGFLWSAGLNPPLAGAVLAVFIPARSVGPYTPNVPVLRRGLADRLEPILRPYVAFGVMPLFALANAGVTIGGGLPPGTVPVFLGISGGLVLGKFIGVSGASWVTVRLRLAQCPAGVTLRHVMGAAWFAGMGFTMALFMNVLAFPPGPLRAAGKMAILMASVVAATLGIFWFLLVSLRGRVR